MGAVAALLALGGIVALAAYSAADEERPGAAPPAAGGPPPPLPPQTVPTPALPAPSPAPALPAPAPTPTNHASAASSPSSADPYTATPVPSHCPPGLNMADPTARALCGPSPDQPSGGSMPVMPASTPSPAPTAATNVPEDFVQRVRAFMQSDPSPEQIEELATQLERAGMPDSARRLRAAAVTRRLERAAEAAAAQATAPPAASPSPSPRTIPAPVPDVTPVPPSPAGTPGPSSSSATDSASSPRPADSGEPLSGRQLAASVAAALRDRLDEIRRLTREFQVAANLTADGRYGPNTRRGLTYWSGRTAPRPWVGSGSGRYITRSVQRGDGSAEAQRAERAARQLFSALLDPEGPVKPELERFQRTVGLTVDGKYGRQSRAALGRLGVANPPTAFRRTRARNRRGSSRRRSG